MPGCSHRSCCWHLIFSFGTDWKYCGCCAAQAIVRWFDRRRDALIGRVKTLFKLIIGLVGLSIALTLGAIIFVLLFVDPNDYRDEIEAAVTDQTGRELAIKGDLSLALLPCCGIQLGETSLSNPPGFPDTGFARVDSVRLGLELLPLLTDRRLVIGEVSLQGLDVALLRRANGKDNWTFESSDTSSTDPATSDDPSSATAPPELTVESIDIADARLSFRDQLDGSDYLLADLNLSTGAIQPGQPFDVKLSGRFEDGQLGVAAVTTLSSQAQLDTSTQVVSLQNTRADIELTGAPAEGDQAGIELTLAEVIHNLDSGTGRLQGLSAQLALAGPSVPDPGLEVGLQMDAASFNANSGTAALEPFTADVQLGAATLAISGSGAIAEAGPSLRGDFRLPAVSPRKLLDQLGEPALETTDPDVLENLEGAGQWSFEPDAVKLAELVMSLDDTRIEGELAVTKLAAPRLRVQLAMDQMDVDRYLAPADEEQSATENGPATQLPREELRDLYVDGNLSVGDLRVAGTRLEQVQATVRARDGVLILAPMTAQLYGGSYEGSIRLDGSGQQTQVALKQSLDAVQVGQLLTDLADVEELQGLVVAKVDLTGSGVTDADLRESLAGTISFELAEGVYKGLDIWHEIRKARARIKGEPVPARTGPAQTPITSLNFGGQVADGVLRSDRLVAQIPFLRVTGKGSLGLAEETLDYRFKARVLQTPEFPDGERLNDLEGLSIPLNIRGTVADPKIGVDLAEFAKSAAGKKIQDAIFKKLGLEEKKPADEPAASPPADGTEALPQAEPEPEQPKQEQKPESPEDLLKRGLRDLLGG
jgi:AsmA protein